MDWLSIGRDAAMAGLAAFVTRGMWLPRVESLLSRRPVSLVADTADIDDIGQQLIDWFDAHGGDVRDEVRDLMRLATDLKFPPKASTK